jgi:hypothetical protein
MDVICRDPRFHSPTECRDILLLEPVTRAAVAAIIDGAAAQGIALRISETYRSPARQQMLFRAGKSRLEKAGTHGYGIACDFFKLVDGEASWAGDWTFLANLADKHGMISGLDWGAPKIAHDWVDPDHIQRCTVENETALFAGAWYPSDAPA